VGGGSSSASPPIALTLPLRLVFYRAAARQGRMARVKAPVYGFYAGDDARIGATLPETIQT